MRILGTSPLDLCIGITRPAIFKEDQFVVAILISLNLAIGIDIGSILSVMVLSCVFVTKSQRRSFFPRLSQSKNTLSLVTHSF